RVLNNDFTVRPRVLFAVIAIMTRLVEHTRDRLAGSDRTRRPRSVQCHDCVRADAAVVSPYDAGIGLRSRAIWLERELVDRVACAPVVAKILHRGCDLDERCFLNGTGES